MSAFRLIAAEKASHPIGLLCEVLGVSRSGFYAWSSRPPSDRALADAWLTDRIKEIHEANRRVYGAPRIHAELQMARGVRVSRKRVERLMRQAGVSGLVPRKRGRTTIRVPGVRVADDLVERRFRPPAPNSSGALTSPTYARGRAGSTSLPSRTSRRIVGWSMADHMRDAHGTRPGPQRRLNGSWFATSAKPGLRRRSTSPPGPVRVDGVEVKTAEAARTASYGPTRASRSDFTAMVRAVDGLVCDYK